MSSISWPGSMSKRVVVGRPMRSSQLADTLLPKRLALPVFCSDPLSSVAYATEEILLILSLGGLAFLHLAWWVAAVIVALLAVVIASYRQTCRAYPNGGGAYAVASANLGQNAGLAAASALLVDYVLTVAVSVVASPSGPVPPASWKPPTACAPPCSRPWATTCAPRCRGSRRRCRACGRRTCAGPTRRSVSCCQTVEESADKLQALVANLLDASRSQAGAVHVDARPLGLDEVVGRVLLGLAPQERRRVVVDVDEGLPEVAADAGLLERALANVVDNALRHAPVGTNVLVRAGVSDGRVTCEVVDHGRGVPARAREQVFAPFQRLGDRSPGGVGLGLAVARGFTEAMGGTLTPHDTPSGGLIMRLTLPGVGLGVPG